MALWMVRVGKHGEHKSRFFGDNRIYLTWEELPDDQHDLKDKAALRKRLEGRYPGAMAAKVSNYTGQVAAFRGLISTMDPEATDTACPRLFQAQQ